MSNTPLNFSDIMDQHKLFLDDEYEVLRQMIVGGKIVKKDDAYMHIKDLLNRRFDGLLDFYKGICTLYKEAFAFALYLH